jgi:glycosyltransferase involved in cell wall biosynthesis
VAGITCQQHGLRYKGRMPCEGKVIPQRCARCRLTAAGVPELVADLASYVAIRGLEDWLPSGLDHVVAGRAMSEEFARYVAALPGHFDRVFVGADWVREVLILNGFERQQIALVRPGLRRDLAEALDAHEPQVQRPIGPLRLVFWGRLDDTKGVDTAFLALRRLQRLPLHLDVVGGFDQQVPFHAKLARMAAGDPRIHFAGRLEAPELAQALRRADVALIPSPVLETGPLTVFEARAAGLPILGARTGGIAETCAGDPSARLFERNDDRELAKLIAELAHDRSQLDLRRALVPRARTMADAAAETLRGLQALARNAKTEPTPVKV